MKRARLSRAETRILEQYWKLGTCSVREILDSLPEDERVAYTTVQTLVYRLEQKGALRKVKKIGNAQLFEAAIDQNQSVVGPLAVFAAGEAELLERGVKQHAGEIAGEGAAGAVGAFQARRQSDDQQPRFPVAERRHRRVEPAGIGLTLCAAERGKARTKRAVRFRPSAPAGGGHALLSLIAGDCRIASSRWWRMICGAKS